MPLPEESWERRNRFGTGFIAKGCFWVWIFGGVGCCCLLLRVGGGGGGGGRGGGGFFLVYLYVVGVCDLLVSRCVFVDPFDVTKF